MNADLLNNEFTESINIVRIEKNIRNILIMIIVGCTYCLLDLFRWYRSYLTTNFSEENSQKLQFYFIFFVSISFCVAILFTVSWLYYLKANRLIKKSFENNDPEIFNFAFKLISKTTIISIIGNCINLISIIGSFFF